MKVSLLRLRQGKITLILALLIGLFWAVYSLSLRASDQHWIPDILGSHKYKSIGVHRISFSPDGKALASVSSAELKLWDVRTKQQRWSITEPLWIISTAFSEDGNVVATGSLEIKLWNAVNGKLLKVLTDKDLKFNDHSIQAVAFSPDGKWLAASIKKGLGRDRIRALGHEYREDTLIKVWDTKTGALLQSFSTKSFNVKAIAFDPQSHQLIFTGDRRINKQPQAEIRWFDIRSGNLKSFTLQNCEYLKAPIIRLDKGFLIGASSNGTRHNTVSQWNLQNGRLFASPLFRLDDPQSCLQQFSLDMKMAAGVCREWDRSEVTEVRLWNVDTGQNLPSLPRTREGERNHVRTVAISPDSKLLATGSKDGLVTLWRPK